MVDPPWSTGSELNMLNTCGVYEHLELLYLEPTPTDQGP